MAKTYPVEKPPVAVAYYFDLNFRSTPDDKYTFKFYWYRGTTGEKVYGCEVYKNGEYYHNATQATVADYEIMTNIPF